MCEDKRIVLILWNTTDPPFSQIDDNVRNSSDGKWDTVCPHKQVMDTRLAIYGIRSMQ